MYLMPPSLQEWLPDDHMVFFLRDVLATVDLSPINSVYEREERGSPPYHPTVMVGILLYGYCHGITSSRKLAVRCLEDVAFRVLAANNAPDFRTISDFRKRHLATLHHLFVEILSLCRKAGPAKGGVWSRRLGRNKDQSKRFTTQSHELRSYETGHHPTGKRNCRTSCGGGSD
jgi:transposase